MGQKKLRRYHATDSSDVETADELRFEYFATVNTKQEEYTIPPTASRGTAATVITNFTIPPMMREVLAVLAVRDLLTTRESEEITAGEDVF